MKFNYLVRNFLTLLIGVGMFGNFIHCAEAATLMATPHQTVHAVDSGHSHHTSGSEERTCCAASEEPQSRFNLATHSSTALAAVLPTPIYQFQENTIPPILLRIIQTKDPPLKNETLLAFNTIRLLL
jgi:hypothetical protein